MKFNLNYTPPKSDFEIGHGDKLLLTGSCFSENIGALLQEHKFDTLNNPDGILFNPLSIYTCLTNSLHKNTFNDKYVLQKDNEYFSYLHHSSINDTVKEKLIEKINTVNLKTFDFIKQCNYLLITFGTAYYYTHTALNIGVSNCHKQPGSFFEKKCLSVHEIASRYNELISELIQLNSNIKIIFTVSPVKYLKGGIIENTISKSTLLLSIHELVQQHKACSYFPAYELVTDDLRDYRFYKEDMAHPNEQAINYVWQKFSDTYFNNETQLLNEKIRKLNTALKHKRLHNNAPENEKFEKHISELRAEIQNMNVSIKD